MNINHEIKETDVKDQAYEERQKEFEDAMRPAMKWIAENCHPHTVIILSSTNAQQYESEHTFNTDEYLVD